MTKYAIVHEAGVVDGITVAVVTSDNKEFAVQMLDTIEGVSDVGQPFVGKGAKADAVVTSNIVYSALEMASMTRECA